MAKEIIQSSWMNVYTVVYCPTFTVHFKDKVIVKANEQFIMVYNDEVKKTLGEGEYVLAGDTIDFLGEVDKSKALPIRVFYVKDLKLPKTIAITPMLYNIGSIKANEAQDAQNILLRIEAIVKFQITDYNKFYQTVINLKLEDNVVTTFELQEATNPVSTALMKDLVTRARGNFVSNLPAMNAYVKEHAQEAVTKGKIDYAKYGLSLVAMELSAVATGLGIETGALAGLKKICHTPEGNNVPAQQGAAQNAPAKAGGAAPKGKNGKPKLHRKGGYVVMWIFGIIFALTGIIMTGAYGIMREEAIARGVTPEELQYIDSIGQVFTYIMWGGIILFAAGLALFILMSVKNAKIKKANK